MKFHRLILLSLVAVAMLSGCGSSSKSSSVTGPSLDTTPPSAPQSLRLVTDPSTGSQTLLWSDGAEADLAMYEVYQFSPDPSRDNSFDLIAETTGASYALPLVARSTTTYFKVRAKDQVGNESAFSAMFAANLTPAVSTGDPDTPPIQHIGP